MPIRFSTQAANADILGDDAEIGGASERIPQPGGMSHQRHYRTSMREARGTATQDAAPGKDINAAGFVKDKDPVKP